MLESHRRLWLAGLGSTILVLAGPPALAQDSNTLGPPVLRDFQLKGERRTPPAPPQQTQPAPTPPPAEQPAPAPRETAGRPAERPAAARPARPAAETGRAPEAEPRPAPAVPVTPQDVFQLPQAPPPASTPRVPEAVPPPEESGTPVWLYLVPAGLALLAGLFFLRRRRRAAEEPSLEGVGEPPRPRPAPIPRPWLEIELEAERAASTETEAWVEFEMVIRNTGKSAARNIRINARMFNAGREQDKEIGAFFKTKGEGRRTYAIPELPAGERGLIQGTVTMPREEMRALKVNDQLLFIPVVGVNTVYDWGNGRTGQTSKSYVIGRELGQESDKMGAFRLDLGPRIYRTVGQRQHSLAKRV